MAIEVVTVFPLHENGPTIAEISVPRADLELARGLLDSAWEDEIARSLELSSLYIDDFNLVDYEYPLGDAPVDRVVLLADARAHFALRASLAPDADPVRLDESSGLTMCRVAFQGLLRGFELQAQQPSLVDWHQRHSNLVRQHITHTLMTRDEYIHRAEGY